MTAELWLGVIGVVTTLSLFLVSVSGTVELLESRIRSELFVRSRIPIPFENTVNNWMKYCFVNLTALQFYAIIVGTAILDLMLAVVLNYMSVIVYLAGILFISFTIMYPSMKRKKVIGSFELQIIHLKQVLAKLYMRNVPLNMMLSIAAESLPDDILKRLIESAVARTSSVDTLTEAIQWLNTQVNIPSLQYLVTTLTQGSRYDSIPIGERLSHMANRDRENLKIQFDAIAERKKLSALIEGSSFIALPFIALTILVVFYYTVKIFYKVHVA